MLNRLCTIFLIAILIFPTSLFAEESAINTVKTHIDNVLKVLRNPSMTGEAAKQEKIDKIVVISESLFDFKELSRRSLAQYWKLFSPEQQAQFATLYEKLLKNTYADRITSYKDENIVFKKEIPLSEKTKEVQTIIVTKTGNVPVDYRLIQNNGHWRVYDVVIEGVSLVNNYRDQFRYILSNNSPDKLIEILRKKLKSWKNIQ